MRSHFKTVLQNINNVQPHYDSALDLSDCVSFPLFDKHDYIDTSIFDCFNI